MKLGSVSSRNFDDKLQSRSQLTQYSRSSAFPEHAGTGCVSPRSGNAENSQLSVLSIPFLFSWQAASSPKGERDYCKSIRKLRNKQKETDHKSCLCAACLINQERRGRERVFLSKKADKWPKLDNYLFRQARRSYVLLLYSKVWVKRNMPLPRIPTHARERKIFWEKKEKTIPKFKMILKSEGKA